MKTSTLNTVVDSKRPALSEKQRQAIKEARKRLYTTSSFWVEEFRARLVALMTNNPNTANQKELAERLGVTPANISSFLHSTSDFKISTYLKVLSGLGYSPFLQFVKTTDMIDAEYEGVEFPHGQVLAYNQALSICRQISTPYYEVEMRSGNIPRTYYQQVDENHNTVQMLKERGVVKMTISVGQEGVYSDPQLLSEPV